MADNSSNRKKTLVVTMLLFLLAGGGVFLFMVIQGSNDLTKGKGNTFTYGAAAREGVSSFFKYLGVSSDEDVMTARKEEMVEKREEQIAAATAANPDMSDWMAPAARSASSSSSSPTSVPKMGSAGLSGAGAIGSGGSKSSGGSSRFSEGSGLGNTRISKGSGSGGTTEKGTLASLTNARAALGEGLRSGSAMTAKSKWDSSFGVGHGAKGGELAYGKSGLVNLDGIKKGEIDNLKTKDLKSLKVTEPGAFQEDKEAESKDAGIQAAKQAAEAAAKKAAEDAAKKAALQAIGNAATSGTSGGGTSRGGNSSDGTGGSGNLDSIPKAVQDNATSAVFSGKELADGTKLQDAAINITKTGDGYAATYTGTATDSLGNKFPYTQTALMNADGTIKAWK